MHYPTALTYTQWIQTPSSDSLTGNTSVPAAMIAMNAHASHQVEFSRVCSLAASLAGRDVSGR